MGLIEDVTWNLFYRFFCCCVSGTNTKIHTYGHTHIHSHTHTCTHIHNTRIPCTHKKGLHTISIHQSYSLCIGQSGSIIEDICPKCRKLGLTYKPSAFKASVLTTLSIIATDRGLFMCYERCIQELKNMCGWTEKIY